MLEGKLEGGAKRDDIIEMGCYNGVIGRVCYTWRVYKGYGVRGKND